VSEKTISLRILGDGGKARVRLNMHIENIGNCEICIEAPELSDALKASITAFDTMQLELVNELRRLGLIRETPKDAESLVS
jgi:hypothetical protein